MKNRHITPLHWLAMACAALIVTACASIGRPQGGPRDEKPPVYVTSNPPMGAKNVNRQRLDIYFNENVQLEDAFSKVVVSPAQKTTPRVSSNGKHVWVDLQDTLLPNTTYTIDFADAIKDLNEGNILDGFATYFSTGESIDSLRISGMVLEARTLEPAQGMLVGVYSNPADSAISTLPLERIARTNQLGQFTIYNLKPGDYRVFAINDINRDYHWDRSEDVAFYDFTVTPSVIDINVTDTLRSSANKDSLVTRSGYSYLPNDILLCWFNEGYASQYLKDYKRPERRYFDIQMAAQADSLPEINIVNEALRSKNGTEWAVLKQNPTLDSLQYWIRDPEVLATDSLYLSVKYQRTDSAGLSWKTDTLKFFFKDPVEKKKKKKEDLEKDSIEAAKPVFMSLSAKTSTQHEVNLPVILASTTPIDTFDITAVHLEVQKDTIWTEVSGFAVEIDSLNPLMQRNIPYKWEPGGKYRLTVDSASVYNIYGEHNSPFKHEFTVKNLEEYSNLTFNVSGPDSCGVVELLDNSDKVMAIAPVVNGKAVFKYLKPGTVYARLFIDLNKNGKWDTGNLLDKIQPEEVYYFPKKIKLKKNWDISQSWNIYETALDLQKPYEIKKNKPKLKKGEQAPKSEDDEEDEDDMFGGNSFGTPGRNNNSRPGNNPMQGLGGFRQNR